MMVSMMRQWLRDLREHKTGAPTMHILAVALTAGLLMMAAQALN